MFLIDTVTISALRRQQQYPAVVMWFERQLSTDPAFTEVLADWLDQLFALYGERILPFDLRTARRWGALSAALGNNGADLMIAATALENGFTVVTRNVSDSERAGVPVLDPFSRRP